METSQILLVTGAGALGLTALSSIVALFLRRVVETNMVHIVQSGRSTTSYGSGQDNGNVYYDWPAWLPVIGVSTISLPVSNFQLALKDYVAYDQDRVPFMVDVVAFFRISDTNRAAQRVSHYNDLVTQLQVIMQGAARTILASHHIDEIMTQRAKFGKAFTDEVSAQLKNWGVETVKNMELMDIRDASESQVIHNIMAKKQSFIEMESRKEVASNHKDAQIAEIAAQRDSEMEKQKALQAIGERTADKDKAIGIATEKATQEINIQKKTTREKEMDVLKVSTVRTAEIEKDKAIVQAEQDKQTKTLIAEGDLAATKKNAEGVLAQGTAKAEAETLMQLAPVKAQTTLAKEIGSNQGYQNYLLGIETISAGKAVGMEQAKALTAADIKVIANGGDAPKAMNSIMELLTPTGGTSIAGMLEAVSQTESGQALMEKIGVTKTPKGKK